MFRSVSIAYSLIRIPRLFGSLLLFPLILSLLLVLLQLAATSAALSVMGRDSARVATHHDQNKSLVRGLILGQTEPLPPPLICRWREMAGAPGLEEPPSPECNPDRLDLAIHVQNPESFDPRRYLHAVEGNVARIHLCRACTPDLIIRHEGGEVRTELRSIWAFGLSQLFYRPDKLARMVVEVSRESEALGDLFGSRFLISSGFRTPVSLTGLQRTLLVAMNLASIIIISLWLALKAHRRVLDYFSRNGALLPMVAATGNGAFYGAIWTITLLRVGLFLLASVPLAYVTLTELPGSSEQELGFISDYGEGALWLVAIFASLALATLVASIADLKHRQHLAAILYRYVPIAVALLGAAA